MDNTPCTDRHCRPLNSPAFDFRMTVIRCALETLSGVENHKISQSRILQDITSLCVSLIVPLLAKSGVLLANGMASP